MKKTIFLAAILIAALGFTGCGGSNKGGDLKIDAKVENGDLVNSYVDEVRAIGEFCASEYPVDDDDDGVIDWYECEDYQNVTIATAPFKNGGFKMTLPKKIDERLLRPLFEVDISEIPEEITISNKNAKIANVDGFLAFKNTSFVGWFYCLYFTTDTYSELVYIFADGDCKISGTVSETYIDDEDGQTYTFKETMDLNLKKGWNAVYTIYIAVGNTETFKMTTQKPDFDLKWYFDGGGMPSAPKKDAKKASKMFKFFK